MWMPFSLDAARSIKVFFQANDYLLSDYSLPSLLAWNSRNNQILFQTHEGLLLLGIGNQQEQLRTLLLPLGLGKDPLNSNLDVKMNAKPDAQRLDTKSLDAKLLKEIAIFTKCSRFSAVPEPLIDENLLTFFEIQEDEQSANYIYLAEELANLKGNRFAAKRNHINGFLKRFSPPRLKLEPITAATVGECMECLERWRKQKPNQTTTPNTENLFEEESAATIAALTTIDKLDWLSLLVRIDGVVCAFAFGARLTKNVVALNFEKALASYRGLYQFLDREFARLAAVSYKYINKESDMGIANLRASKESYHPYEMLRSFSLFLR